MYSDNDGPGGVSISYQEQPSWRGECVHTHVWFSNDKNLYLIDDFYNFVISVYERYPSKISKMALVIGWHLADNEQEFDGPDICYELIVDRKLSEKLMREVFGWFCEVYIDLVIWRGMRGLFGEVE